MKKISIILCTFNEANYIATTIKFIFDNLENFELIIVDDNSDDGTIDIIKNLKNDFLFKFILREKERGLASAQKKGFEVAESEYVGTIDVNSRDQILYFKKLRTELDQGNYFSVLSRYINGGGDERVFLRSFASKMINKFCKLFLRSTINDYTSGIFLTRKDVLLKNKEIITGYSEWVMEYIYRLKKNNLKLSEIPYIQKKDAKDIQSKSFPNLFTFFYLGSKYFLRIFITLSRS
jgi:dolichol-phosphate mannosyltransferase